MRSSQSIGLSFRVRRRETSSLQNKSPGGQSISRPRWKTLSVVRDLPAQRGRDSPQEGHLLSSFPASAINVQHCSLLAPVGVFRGIPRYTLTIYIAYT
jgi:hypothetical protein